MPTFDQLKSTFDNRDMSPAVGEHYSFYLRGIINAALPDFMSPLTRTVTEDGVSGEFLEALRLTASTLYPDMQDGDVKQITYDDLMGVLGGVSIFDKDDRYNIKTVGERIRTSLGNFGLTKEDGQYVVFDTYDFEPTDSSLTDAAGQLFSEGVYPAARTIGGMIMPENADGSSDDDALKIRIRIPNEPSTIDVDYDDDPPEGAQDMVLRGPMTNKRKSIWDSFTGMLISEANAFVGGAAEEGTKQALQGELAMTPLGDTDAQDQLQKRLNLFPEQLPTSKPSMLQRRLDAGANQDFSNESP